MYKKKKHIILYIFVLSFLIYILFIDSSSFLQKYFVRKENAKLKENIIALEKENERLRKENSELLSSNKIIEKKAREFGMQKKGEEIFIFKSKDE
ncbi:MAG: septum formation initiator family protein [Candidatus Cloacimonetes bacterium]|nr:septum formation initiator family protein [Candidatus Cloacimonadota bacterium]